MKQSNYLTDHTTFVFTGNRHYHLRVFTLIHVCVYQWKSYEVGVSNYM